MDQPETANAEPAEGGQRKQPTVVRDGIGGGSPPWFMVMKNAEADECWKGGRKAN